MTPRTVSNKVRGDKKGDRRIYSLITASSGARVRGVLTPGQAKRPCASPSDRCRTADCDAHNDVTPSIRPPSAVDSPIDVIGAVSAMANRRVSLVPFEAQWFDNRDWTNASLRRIRRYSPAEHSVRRSGQPGRSTRPILPERTCTALDRRGLFRPSVYVAASAARACSSDVA